MATELEIQWRRNKYFLPAFTAYTAIHGNNERADILHIYGSYSETQQQIKANRASVDVDPADSEVLFP